jgi:transcriptional regulator with XRE-family HTH domain/Zn-dependent peptidase ImmA (M78 family)
MQQNLLCQDVRIAQILRKPLDSDMNNQTVILVQLMQAKREREGFSLRQLSSVIGVSFSTLARIERGDGEPDNNTKIRILEWLGNDARKAGLQFDSVALVHFRAKKQVDSRTVQALLIVANYLKQEYELNSLSSKVKETVSEDFDVSVALTKDDMEMMSESFRKDVGLSYNEPFDPFRLKIEGVKLVSLSEITDLDKQIIDHLSNSGKQNWSAMSVPLEEHTDKWAIVWNNFQSRKRQRVSLLEEIWHILLGHKLTRITKVADVFGRTFAEVEEHDAYYLAAATLLPASVVREVVKEKRSVSESAAIYGTTEQLLEYRIKRLGLWRQFKGLKVEMKSEE